RGRARGLQDAPRDDARGARRRGARQPLSDDEVSANVLTLLLAGEDTTAIMITSMLYFLACDGSPWPSASRCTRTSRRARSATR
ncbi:MAG: cytochrome P450, partial [Polyangiaceae bacterium]|nr:cytochrome P450 [Polyangiaceae bacterium]